jgi:hypothetical protein
MSSPQHIPKPPKIFIPTAIKNPQSWRSERGQLDKIELVGKNNKAMEWRIDRLAM